MWQKQSNVVSMEAAHNRLLTLVSMQSLPRSIGKLKRLSNFNCDRNQLTSLPKEVSLSRFDRHRFSLCPVANLSGAHSAKDVTFTSLLLYMLEALLCLPVDPLLADTCSISESAAAPAGGPVQTITIVSNDLNLWFLFFNLCLQWNLIIRDQTEVMLISWTAIIVT